MRCDRRLLSFYRDGELTPDQKWEVDAHLRECADCTATLRGYQRLGQTVRSMPIQSVPPALTGELRQKLAGRRQTRRSALPLGTAVRAAAPAFAAAAVAVAVLVLIRPGAGEPRQAPAVAAPPAPSSPSQPVAAEKEAPPAVVVTTPSIVRVSRDGPAGLGAGSLVDERLVKTPASIARLYAGSEALREQLGLPADGSKSVTLLEQSFQGGLALWRSDTRQIYVLNRVGDSWAVYPDTWRSGDPVAIAGAPPPGAAAPSGGFGHLWVSQPDVQSKLGWAVYDARGAAGAIQSFERGMIIWNPHGLLYVLTADGKWKTYPDAAPL